MMILPIVVWYGTPEWLKAFGVGSRRWVRPVMGIVIVALGTL
jgi:hypothetical protein